MTPHRAKGNKEKQIEKTAKATEVVAISIYKGKCGHWDFGNFPSDYKILQFRPVWKEYLNARYAYELLHDKLIKVASKKYKNL